MEKPPRYAKEEPRNAGTFFLVMRWNSRVPRPAHSRVVETLRPVSSGTSTVYNDMSFLWLSACEFACINQTCKSDNSSSVLVIMEDRDIAALLQLFLDFKASWCRNIFKVNTAKCRSNVYYSFDDFFCVLCIKADRHSINVTKFFEKNSFSFHNRHSGMSTDITESKYSTSVRYNSDSVRLDSVLISCFFVLGNNLARFCYTRSISKSKIFSCLNLHFRSCFKFTIPLFMEL